MVVSRPDLTPVQTFHCAPQQSLDRSCWFDELAFGLASGVPGQVIL